MQVPYTRFVAPYENAGRELKRSRHHHRPEVCPSVTLLPDEYRLSRNWTAPDRWLP
jgi:hypothetical protein